MRPYPLDPDLYEAVVEEAKARFAVWPSAYASGWVVKAYKARGGKYAGEKSKQAGLGKWFKEEWVDLSRPTDDGSYEPCGRERSDDPADYPKCRPLAEALRMSPDEVADAVRRKRRVEASAPARSGRARPPQRVKTYRNPRQVTRKVTTYMRTKPTDVRLRKSLARFDKLPPDEREGLRLALIEVVFYSIGIDHYDRRASSDELLDEYGTDERLAGKSVIDGYVPWLATRLSKERFENQREADATLDALKKRFRTLCIWAKETGKDLASSSISDALAASKTYQAKAQQKGKEESDVNPTLYRFADGWKVVEPRTEKALKREGDLMSQTCGWRTVGWDSAGCWDLLVRDPENKSHVTMEYLPEKQRLEQILGPSNQLPEEYTVTYLREFIEKKFGGNDEG